MNELDAGDPNHSYAYAVALLARRDYSTRELRQKLSDRGYLENAIEPVLIDLEETRKLDDQRYGANVVAYRARRGQGPARIRSELRRSGLKDDQIDEAVKTGDDAPDFIALAREARRRKFGSALPADWKERAKQARFLQYRGFSTDHIRAALESDLPDGETE
ncbi:MAG TPA: regulatory protein RecX [Steroidobacteraceae bacterium]|nr:regulatory protein RecX [Steroidobacteraceae bacterium]